MRPTKPRQLAVVMFADIVGYTSIVHEDEARATSTRAALSLILGEVLAARGGTLVQSFGDGTLSVFSSAVEGALGAADVKARFTHETGADLRIGLHLGEISWDAEGAYGDAVNVAARLQAIATPGSVLMSEEIARQLKSHRDVPCVEVGPVRLKNVEEPVRVYALALAGLIEPGLAEVAQRAREGGGGAASTHETMPKSLAVLPLANFSHEPSQEYFVAGMHEALLTELARIRALKVISRTSVLRYRDTTEPIADIAKALGVDALIEGSVLRAGDRVRITAQLIAIKPERHLWAESYDGDMGDVLALHGRVASAIATAVQSTLQPREQARLRERRQVDPDAYEAYLRGRYAASQLHEDASQNDALAHFELAASIDPAFALPWVGIARALTYRALFGHLDRARTIDRCRQAIAHALELDPDLAEAHATRGQMNLIFNADADAAVRDLERALALEPNSVPALVDYGVALNGCGRYQDSADAFDRAVERDPLSPTTAMMRGWGRFMSRRFEDACRILEHGTRIAPDFSYNHLWLAAALVPLGRLAEAHAAATRAEELEGDGDDRNFQVVIAWVWAGLGELDKARRQRDRMMQPRKHGASLDPGFLTVTEFALGDPDAALRHLEESVATRSPILFHMPGHPFLDALRADPRFGQILAKGGLKVLEA